MTKRETIKYTLSGHSIALDLVYDDAYDIDALLQHLEKALKVNVEFYAPARKLPTEACITLLYTRQQYDEVVGYASEAWASGYSTGNNAYLFHPDCIERETIHTRESFPKTLTHELSHIFIRTIANRYLWWVTEGVAQYLAKQDTFVPLKKESIKHFVTSSLARNIKYSEFLKAQGHQIARQLAYAIVHKHGEGTLFALISADPETENTEGQIARSLGVPEAQLKDEIELLLANWSLAHHLDNSAL